MASQIPSSIPEPSEPRTSNGAQDLVSVCTDTPMDGEGSSEQNGAAQTSPKVEPQPQAVPRRSGNRARVHPFPLTLPFSTKRRKSEAVQHAVHVSASAVQVQDLGPSPSDRHSSVFDMLERRRGPQAPWKQKVRRFLEGPSFTVISIIFTLLILYTDLIRAAVAPPQADPYFLAFTIFAICAFFAEITISSICRADYFLKFYFWMDILASFSLLCDIPGFMDAITPGNGDNSNRHVTLDRAAKAAQAGARSARIMQVIALAQLLRYKAQRMKMASKFTLTEDGIVSNSSTGEDEGADGKPKGMNAKPQTRVGEKLTEMTMRKVILGVLLMLLVLPVFDANVYYGHPTFLEDGGLVMLHDLYGEEGNSTTFQNQVQAYMDENVYKMGTKDTGYLYRLQIYNITIMYGDPNLRSDEIETSTVQTSQCSSGPWDQCFISKAWVNVKWAVQMQALLDIGRVTFVLSALSLGALLFIRDTDKLVLQPIERMVSKVKLVSQNPLAASAAPKPSRKNSNGSGKQLETRVLEQSIAKICSLLSVGFGEAGAEVIADNIKSGGDLNPMVPGRRVTAIFGFCDIRQFTDTTEVLQEEVMEFVNSIASIVHSEVSLHGGAANKNIGDAFLVVWKLPGSSRHARNNVIRSSVIGAKAAAAGPGGPHEEEVVTHLADAALAAFIIIQAALKRSKKLQEYSSRSDLNARMPNFSVKLGFGLHVGWAIEGAIGSHHKIDASYLSPHVNMAARLEAATKQFGVPLLLSESFVSLLSPAVRRRCRQIDCVTVKGSNQPIGLFTLDVDAAAAAATEPSAHPMAQHGPTAMKGSDHLSFSDYPYFDEFEEHPDIVATRAVDEDFLARFAEGFQAYRAGNWQAAAAVLEETRTMRRNGAGDEVVDGPSEALLAVIRDSGGRAPAGWAGYRELTEK